MFKHFSEHFLTFSWVYLIPTYVRQLPPPPQRNPFLNMDSSPYSSAASPSLEGCSPSARTAKASILSCFSSDGSFDSSKYMLYAMARSSCARRSILMAMKNSPDHDGSTAAQAEDRVTPVKTPDRKCILARKGTEDGPLELIMPKESSWYQYYIAIFLLYDVNSPMAKKFHLRFRIPFQSYLELFEQIKADDRFEQWCGFKKFKQTTSPIGFLVLGSLHCLGRGWTFDGFEENTAISQEVPSLCRLLCIWMRQSQTW